MKNEEGTEEFEKWISSMISTDPCWRISNRYVDPCRLEPLFREFDLFEQQYPIWVDHLYSGLPTYYGILCVTKNASLDMIKEAYDKKKRYSSYPEDIIDDAFNVLRNPELRMKYDKLLQLFERMSQGLIHKKKKEIREEHEKWLKEEERCMKGIYMVVNYPDWIGLLCAGAPTFYEILGVDRDASQDDIKSVYESEGRIQNRASTLELLEEVYKVLSNQQLRREYDLMLNSFDDIPEDVLKKIREKQKFSKQKIDDEMILLHIKLHRWEKIMHKHPDWREYLPPNKETFYDVLQINIGKLPTDTKDIEKEIRDKYRDIEKSSVTNLAYSVLKNSNLREEYNWMLKNHEIMKRQED